MEALLEAREEIDRREDYRAGVVAAQVTNANRQKETDKVWVAEDFFPSLRPPVEEMTDDEIAAKLTAMWGTTPGGAPGNPVTED
jgi:hypothetical protein